MSDIAAKKPFRQLFASEHVEAWARFKWLLPILITVVVTIVALVHYWTFLDTDGAKYIPVGFAIVLAVFLSALPAVMCFVQNVSRRRQLSKLNDLSALPVATTAHYRTAIKASDSVRLLVDVGHNFAGEPRCTTNASSCAATAPGTMPTQPRNLPM